MKRILFYIFSVLFLSFGFVEASASTMEDYTISTERFEKETNSVNSTPNGIKLGNMGDTTERFYIFSITGQLVKTVDVQSSEVMDVDLPRGCYIIKCAHWSKKIMVK